MSKKERILPVGLDRFKELTLDEVRRIKEKFNIVGEEFHFSDFYITVEDDKGYLRAGEEKMNQLLKDFKDEGLIDN